MKNFVLILLAVLLFSGCAANKQWVKPGATVLDFERDKAQCEYEATIYAKPSTGYRTAVGAGLDQALQQVDLYMKCMRAKGWSLVDTPPK